LGLLYAVFLCSHLTRLRGSLPTNLTILGPGASLSLLTIVYIWLDERYTHVGLDNYKLQRKLQLSIQLRFFFVSFAHDLHHIKLQIKCNHLDFMPIFKYSSKRTSHILLPLFVYFPSWSILYHRHSPSRTISRGSSL